MTMTQTDELSSVVRTQLIPLVDMNMLLPNTCIAEVIALGELTPVENAPEWLLGMMNWRGVNIPVISFEAANGIAADAPTRHSRVAVLNGLTGDDKLPFYGVVSQGIPKLMALEKSAINAIKQPEQKLPLASEQIQLTDVTAVIPDQKKIEKLLLKVLKNIK
jgi:chemosensory pili system protein ChpC